tara:strand:- start:232 stop:462 length:231 start_codon:yes stop_codon:yes gene_type:complete
MKKMTNPFEKPSGASDYVDGLYVKDGRLRNDRRDGETGIAQMSRMKHAADRQKKISEIADGIERAEDNKRFRNLDF